MEINKKGKRWYNYPNVVFTGILVLYLVIRIIGSLFNFEVLT